MSCAGSVSPCEAARQPNSTRHRRPKVEVGVTRIGSCATRPSPGPSEHECQSSAPESGPIGVSRPIARLCYALSRQMPGWLSRLRASAAKRSAAERGVAVLAQEIRPVGRLKCLRRRPVAEAPQSRMAQYRPTPRRPMSLSARRRRRDRRRQIGKREAAINTPLRGVSRS